MRSSLEGELEKQMPKNQKQKQMEVMGPLSRDKLRKVVALRAPSCGGKELKGWHAKKGNDEQKLTVGICTGLC